MHFARESKTDKVLHIYWPSDTDNTFLSISSINESVIRTSYYILGSIHFKLQTAIRITRGIDVTSYLKLQGLIKGTTRGYESKKFLVSTDEDIRKFTIQSKISTRSWKLTLFVTYLVSVKKEICDLCISDIQSKEAVLIIHKHSFKKIDNSNIELRQHRRSIILYYRIVFPQTKCSLKMESVSDKLLTYNYQWHKVCILVTAKDA